MIKQRLRYLSVAALCDEWRRKDARGQALRALTVLVVLWLSINPSLLPLAAWVDSVGIDAALALLEMQLVVGLLLALQLYCPRVLCALTAAAHRIRRFGRQLRVFTAMYVRDF